MFYMFYKNFEDKIFEVREKFSKIRAHEIFDYMVVIVIFQASV